MNKAIYENRAVAVAAAAVCLFLCFLCGFSRSATAGRCAAGSL
ncbi:hypothetical protein [Streptomyces sp. NBC_00162]|nr:hypothetical protein [Streptomyces sp. NBC_00162]UUU45148.1 hypothetical protein JIW86_41155 [Streptomyces sp. NBC_00162]